MVKMIEFCSTYILLGMCRSVKNNNRQRLHPVRDASLTGCKRNVVPFFTERCIPNGIRGFGDLNHCGFFQSIFLFVFFSGFCLSLVAQRIEPFQGENGKWGLVKITEKCGTYNRIIVEPKYDSCNYDQESAIAVVKLNGEWGFVDTNGKEIMPIKYDFYRGVCKGYAIVKSDEKWGIVNTDGKVTILSNDYDDIGYSFITMVFPEWGESYEMEIIQLFWGENIAVVKNGKWGFINKNGEEITPLKYDSISNFNSAFNSASFALVQTGEKWGVVDAKGEEITPMKYDEIDIKDSFFIVRLDGKEGVVNFNGKEVISLKWDWCSLLDNETTIVCLNEKRGFIENYTEKEIIPVKHGYIRTCGEVSHQIIAELNGKYGFMDKTGKEIIPFQYTYISYMRLVLHYGFLLAVELDNKWGVLDTNGKEILPIKYDAINPYQDIFLVDKAENPEKFGYIVVKLDKKLGIIDTAGKEILSIKYDKCFPITKNLTVVALNGKESLIRNITEEIILLECGFGYGVTYNTLRIFYYEKIIFIDKITGEQLAVITCDDYCILSDDYIAIKKDLDWGVVSSVTGEEVLLCKYDLSEIRGKLQEILEKP